MPDFGLTEALQNAVREGADSARVMRPAERELAKQAAAKAAAEAKGPAMATMAPPDVTAPTVDVSEPPPVVTPAAPVAPAEVPPPIDTTAGIPQTPPPAPKADATPDPVAPNIPPPPDVPTPEMQAIKLSKATLGDYALDASHQPNFDVMTTTDDIKGVIAELADQNAAKIDVARRGTITNEQLQGLANDLDTSTDVIGSVLKRESGGVIRPEVALAARQVLGSSADRLKTLADKITTGQATDMEKVQFSRQVQFHNEFQTQFMGARAEAGRLLNAFGIPVGSDQAVASRIGDILANSGTDYNRIAKAISMTNSVSGVTQAAKASLWRRIPGATMGLINRFFVNGILSGPLTHLKNMGGNALFMGMNSAELAIAARLGRFLPGDEHVQAGEALANLYGTLGATRDAWRLFRRALVTGQSLDGVIKFEPDKGTLLDTTKGLPELDLPYLGRAIRGIETGIGLPTRALGAEDDLFKTFAQRADLQRRALLHVQDQLNSGAIKMEDAAQTAKDFMEQNEDAQNAAEEWAHDMTFQTPLGPNGQKFEQAIRSVPVLSLIAPFIRTPTNIFKQAIYRGPMAIFTSKFWNAVATGGRERDLALTRFALGSGTAALVAHHVASGDMTGGGPQNPDQRMLWMENGRRPYSIKVTDPVTGDTTWHSYAAMEPLASVLGATADATEILSYIESDTDTLQDPSAKAYAASGAIIAGIMNNSGNKTFMKGISDFVELMNDPAREIQSYSNQMAASLVPYSGALRTVRNTQDPYLREAWTWLDKIKDEVPGYSKDLPLRLDLFGEPREKNSSTLLGTMSPIPESPQKFDPVVSELTRVMDATKSVPVTMPDKRIEGMRLNAREYTDLVRISRHDPVFGGDQTFHDALMRVMNSSVYKSAPPLEQSSLLRHMQEKADQIGRYKLERLNPEFAERIAVWRMQKNRLYFDK